MRYTQFVMQALHVRVYGVWGHAQLGSHGRLGPAIEHAAKDVQFAPGQLEGASHIIPGPFREDR